MNQNNNIDYFIKDLHEKFPEFFQEIEPYDMLPFNLFGDFALYICDKIEEGSFSEEELNKVFDFLNYMGEHDDMGVQNLLTVGVLEILTDNESSRKAALKYLKGIALEDYKLIYKYWYGD